MSIGLNRIRRIPARISEDLHIIKLAKNWPQILSAKARRSPVSMISLRNGVKFASPPEIDLSFLFHEIWIDRIYCPKGYEIDRGDVVIDIGGNIGVFAAFVAVQDPNIKVFSFEPFPENAEYFERNISSSKLKNVTLYQKAVAGKVGTRTLRVSDSWVAHSLGSEGSAANTIEVECVPLDDVLKETGYCSLLKIDCEGSEYEIFESASANTLQKINKVVCEFHENDEGNGESLRTFFEANHFRIDAFERMDEQTGLICATNLSFERM